MASSHSAVTTQRRTGLPLSSVLGYSSGNFGFALLGLVVAVNLQFFYTDYVDLSAGLVSWSLLLARMFDAVTDPVMGYLSDRANTRIGRRRPFFLGAALTDDYQERVKVIALRETFSLVGLLAATVLPAFLIHAYGGRLGYSFMGAILGSVMAASMILAALTSRERAEFHGRPSLSPYAGWAETLRNPHFRPLLGAFTLSAIAGATPAVLVIYVSVYIIGTPAWWDASIPGWLPTWSYYLLVYFSAGVLSLPIWNSAAARFGKRATWGAAIVLATLTSAGCWWLDEGTVGYFTALLVLGGMGFGNYLAIPPSMVADLIDWDEVRTGGRREGSYFAIWAFATKLGAAVTGFACLQVLERVGYVPGVEQTELVKTWMLWMYSWFPALFYLLSGLVLLRFRFTRADLRDAQVAVGRAP